MESCAASACPCRGLGALHVMLWALPPTVGNAERHLREAKDVNELKVLLLRWDCGGLQGAQTP